MSSKSQNWCTTDAVPFPYVLTNQELQHIRIFLPQPSSAMHLYRRYERVDCGASFIPTPLIKTHARIYAMHLYHENKPDNTSQQSHIHYIPFQNTWIHYFPSQEEINKQKRRGKKKIKICLQPNRIDLKSKNSVSDPRRSWIRVRWSPFIQVCQGLFRLVYC